MILDKLLLAENTIKENMKLNIQVLAAIRSIRKLLRQIDFTSEVVPVEDKEKLNKLLVSLKGNMLNNYETVLVEEITKKQKKPFDIGRLVNEYHTN